MRFIGSSQKSVLLLAHVFCLLYQKGHSVDERLQFVLGVEDKYLAPNRQGNAVLAVPFFAVMLSINEFSLPMKMSFLFLKMSRWMIVVSKTSMVFQKMTFMPVVVKSCTLTASAGLNSTPRPLQSDAELMDNINTMETLSNALDNTWNKLDNLKDAINKAKE
ncbi:MAG: hypothetical protein QNL62_02245 [Gammaproteobacteria bacterium]|nr:hypothetical protein [Gammaproteobacteria bacterium]